MSDFDFGARLSVLRRRLPAIGSWQAYLFALGLLAAGALLRAPFDASVNQRLPPFLTIYPMVVIASFAGGWRVGAATAFAGGFMAWLLWAEPYGWEIPPYAAITFAVYVLAVGITVAAGGLARHLFESAARREKERAAQAGETVHRLKNLLAVVQALARTTAKQAPDMPAFLQTFDAQLKSLATAQNVLIGADFDATKLEDVVAGALGPFLSHPQVDLVGGPPLVAPARLVSDLSLALYELATNAVKHGALNGDGGAITISWRQADGRVLLEWNETGAVIVRNKKDGAGAGVIRNALRATPGAQVHYEVGARGARCVFDWPQP